jgi:hypothetical protein
MHRTLFSLSRQILGGHSESKFQIHQTDVSGWKARRRDGSLWIPKRQIALGASIDSTVHENLLTARAFRDIYKLMCSGIIPRPVAFVSSESANGVQNLAPFSWFNMVDP